MQCVQFFREFFVLSDIFYLSHVHHKVGMLSANQLSRYRMPIMIFLMLDHQFVQLVKRGACWTSVVVAEPCSGALLLLGSSQSGVLMGFRMIDVVVASMECMR